MEQSTEFLVVSLWEKALQIFQYLPIHETLHFDTLVNALEEKFNPSQQCEMYNAQLRSRTKSPKESLQDLSLAIQRLISRAYPQASLSTHEEIAKDYFIDTLPGENDMRLLVRRSKPPNIHEALREALELEAIQNAESKSIGPRHSVRLAGSTEQRSKENQMLSNHVRNLKDIQLINCPNQCNSYKQRQMLLLNQVKILLLFLPTVVLNITKLFVIIVTNQAR